MCQLPLELGISTLMYNFEGHNADEENDETKVQKKKD